ncbi:MAG: transposase domain-containing protein [Pseudomonadales bacterium]|nr:transposase domain-containing protein [Pseudomonadales bacterium]
MTKTITDDERWYPATALAGLPGLPATDRGLTLAGDRGDYPRRKRTEGKGWEYALSGLPLAAQRALILRDIRSGAMELPRSDGPVSYDRDELWAHFAAKTAKQKAHAEAKLQVFIALKALLDAGHPQHEAVASAAADSPWSWRTIRDNWHGKPGRPGLKQYDPDDWLPALTPSHIGRTKQVELSGAAWEFIKGDYLRPEKPGLSACYRRLQAAAQEHGWIVPSVNTIKRRIKRLPAWIKILKREGEAGLLAMYPAMQRRVCELHALEWINGDGYMHNVMVRWPDGKIARPKTWFWQDIHSRKMLAYETDETEHSDMIRRALGRLIEQYGIPKHATIDNTRAAANKWLTGGVPNRYRFKVQADDPMGLFPKLGVKVHWTSVQAGKGHGQAKPVERAFGIGGIGEYVDRHPALAGAYTGTSPIDKPDNYGERAVPIELFLQILAQGVASWNATTKRRSEMAHGVLSFDQVFEQSYGRAVIRKATAAQRQLWMLTAEAVRVAKDGSVALDAGSASDIGRNRYACDALAEYIGQKVVIRFDPDKLHEEVHAYSLDGRYIAVAECTMSAGFGDQDAGRQYNRQKREWVKAKKQMAKNEGVMSALQVAQQLPAPPVPEPPKAGAEQFDFRHRRAAGDALARDESLSIGGDDFILSLPVRSSPLAGD